jgi:hypothetical protein
MTKSSHTVTFEEETMFNLKQALKKMGKKATVQTVVDYSLQLTINALKELDEDTLEVIKPKNTKE